MDKEFSVDEDFVKLWRRISVEAIEEWRIEQYLEKRGFTLPSGSSYWRKPKMEKVVY